MSNKNYVKGRNFEYRVMAFLRKHGYYCIRSYGSKGPFDVIAIPPSKGSTLLIQAKYNGYVPKNELQELKENQKKFWGLVTIAYSENHKLRFKDLNNNSSKF